MLGDSLHHVQLVLQCAAVCVFAMFPILCKTMDSFAIYIVELFNIRNMD